MVGSVDIRVYGSSSLVAAQICGNLPDLYPTETGLHAQLSTAVCVRCIPMMLPLVTPFIASSGSHA